jgi:menaquinone-dependent protoporphyrinogen oxidase
MMSRNVLVAYATKSGGTAAIAEAVGDELRDRGHQVAVRDVSQVGSIADYDAVVLGSAIRLGRWRPEAVRFLRRHSDELRNRQVWLFHSGPLGPQAGEAQAMPPNVQRLVRRIGATPAMTFGGRLDWNLIRAWARDIGAAICAVEVSSWHRPALDSVAGSRAAR